MKDIAQKVIHRIILVISIVLLIACAEQSAPKPVFVTTAQPNGNPQFSSPTQSASYPAPNAPPAAGTAYPAPPNTSTEPPATADGRRQSALSALKVAQKVAAERYDPKSQLYAVIPSQTMLANLRNPPVLPGWFYKFKIPGQTREFIVQVVDDSATGTTTAEPLKPLNPAELPIDAQQLKLDSPQVFEQFQAFAAKQQLKTQGITYDLDLVNLEGTVGPVWSVVDPATKQRIYSVNAITGEEIPNFGK